jgi:hypothetical protein
MTSKGNSLLQSLQAVEFLNAYYKYVPSTLQMTVTSILNLLISPQFPSEPSKSEEYIPSTFNLEYIEKNKVIIRVEENSEKPCEFPPVLLCESDEKLLFEATVTLKFGAAEEILTTCSEIKTRLLKDFPVDVFLQHGDLIRSLVSLVRASSEKKVSEVGVSVLSVLSSFIRKLGYHFKELQKPEYRVATALSKKLVSRSEYLELSSPSLKVEQYEIGTPGPTFSTFFAVEFIMSELPLEYFELTASVLDVWKEAEWIYEQFAKYPVVLTRLLKILSEGISKLSSDFPLFTERLVQIAENFLASLTIESCVDTLRAAPWILEQLAEFSLFRHGRTCNLIQVFGKVCPEVLNEFRYAQESVQAVEGVKSMSQILLNQEVLPIQSLSAFSKAVEFFRSAFPALEYGWHSGIIRAVIDLNCYSVFIQNNSTGSSRREECLGFLMSLLASPISSISSVTVCKMTEMMSSEVFLSGIAKDAKRKELLKTLILTTPVLSVIIIKHQETDLLIKLMKDPEDYEKLVPFFTVLQSYNQDNLEGILHLVSLCNPALSPLRFFRDLFSSSANRRAVAVTVLKGSSSPEAMQEKWKGLVENMWNSHEIQDPVSNLAAVPELDTITPVKGILEIDELCNLLNIFRSKTLEPNLKVSASEQILLQLYSGVPNDPILEEILLSTIDNLLPDTEDRYQKRLISKSLQILVILSLKYESRCKKLYNSSLKFMCSLIPYIFSSYDQIRHYSLYLLYILSFSNLTTRNRFIPGDLFSLVPESPSPISPTVPVVSVLFPGFLQAFPTLKLIPDFHSEDLFMQVWKNVPSSARVRSFVQKEKKLEVDVDSLLDNWKKRLDQAETHKNILVVCSEWINSLKVAVSLPGNLDWKLLKPNNDLVSCVLSILKAPPVNSAEDSLHISLHQVLKSAISLVSEKCKVHLEFVAAVAVVVSKNSIPFISELSEIVTRRPLILSILSLFQELVPFHGSMLEGERTLYVLTSPQLSPGENSFISLLSKIAESTDDISLLESVFETLTQLSDHPQLEVSSDLFTSPSSQKSVLCIVRAGTSKVPPFINPSTFLYKSAGKSFLQLLIRVNRFIEFDSLMWCIRFAEDRDVGLRALAWGLLSHQSMECYSLHSSSLDIALEVVFGLAESFIVKTHACRFLCGLTHVLMNSEESVHRAGIMKSFYQYSVISHIKSLLYENSGPPPVYFAVLVSFLSNLAVLDISKVLPVCTQIEIWEGLLRVLRPGSLEERAKNERRKPFKELEFQDFEQELLAITSISAFFTNVIRNDIQVLDYLLETSHFIGYFSAWIDVVIEKFDHKREILYSRALLGLINVIHLSLFKSIKSKRHLQDFSYEKLGKILEMTQSKEVKLASARFLTSLLPTLPSSNCEKILLHLISLFKSTDVLSEHKEVLKAISSLLFHDESSKIVAINTGFSETLQELALKLISQIQALDLQKTKKREEEQQALKQLIDYFVLFKLWASNSYSAKVALSIKDAKLATLPKLLFHAWNLGLRKDELLKNLLETLCTLISACEEGKKACSIVQESRSSLLSLILEYISRPNSASETCFQISLKILGSLCSCKESRQLLIKSKFPQGLALRLVKEWNELKTADDFPKRSPFIIDFLSNFAFFPEGQKVIASITGLIDVLVEVLDRFSKKTFNSEAVEQTLLLLRNLSFSSSNKPSLVANQQALPIILSFISSPSQKPRMRKLASSALWALLFNYQKFKGILSKEHVLSELENVYKEVTRDSELAKDKQNAEDLKAVSENLNCVLKICIGN